VIVDVLDDTVRQEVSAAISMSSHDTIAIDSLDAHAPSDEQPDLCRRDVVVDELFDDNYIPSGACHQHSFTLAPYSFKDGIRGPHSPVMIENVVGQEERPDV
jgi:hypothetical protein